MFKRMDHWKQMVQIEHKALVEEMTEEMKQLVQGTVTTEELTKLGHPFGRRQGGRKRGRIPNLPINKQSGDLLRSFVLPVQRTANVISYLAQFTIPYAKYVLNPSGTRKMVGRGYWRECIKRYKKKKSELVRRLKLTNTL